MKNKINKKTGIYIHIPFCIKKCEYCDFLSAPGSDSLKQEYVKALKKEIVASARLYSDYEIQTIFFGGGTPSILPPENIKSILNNIREQFPLKKDTEITIEANPGTLNHEKLSIYKKAGVNRLSIGLQSARNEELNTLGRIHTFKEFLESYDMARETGFKNINVDLMSGLPGQTLKSWEETLNKVISLNPEHISAYSLIIEEGTPFFEQYDMNENEHSKDLNTRKRLLPDEDTERKMYHLTNKMLKENGYDHYEISNYSKPSFSCKHNLAYWERKNYLGLGVSSASLMGNLRFTNTRDITEYIRYSSDLNRIQKDISVLTKKEEMEEFMFLGLRTMKGISLKTFHEYFGDSFLDIYGTISKELIQLGLLETTNPVCEREQFLRLTEDGVHVSNYVMAQYLLD